MRKTLFYLLAAVAAPASAAAQAQKPATLQPPVITSPRVSQPNLAGQTGPTTGQQPAGGTSLTPGYTGYQPPNYEQPQLYAPGQQAPGLLSRAPSRATTTFRNRIDLLALPLLGGLATDLRLLAPGSLYAPPVELDETGQPITQRAVTGAPAVDPNSPAMRPAELLTARYLQPEYIARDNKAVLQPNILGFTDYVPILDVQRVRPGEEGAAETGPTFGVLGEISIAPRVIASELRAPEFLGLPELNYASADGSRFADTYFRIASRITATNIMPWAGTTMPQLGQPASESMFRLPPALAHLVNTNINFGLGIPNYAPNVGMLTYGYLGLGEIFDYVSPDVAQRLQPFNNQTPR